MKKQSLLFFGTPQFVTPTLESLVKDFDVRAVVTQPDKPVGRKKEITSPPVKLTAEKLGLKILQPTRVEDIQQELELLNIDFIVTFAYGEYLPESILNIPSKRALNIHPSLLPKYRGSTPIQSALLNGDKITGVSIIEMTKNMDAGTIYSQQEVKISPDDTNENLQQKVVPIATKLITQVIKSWKTVAHTSQDESKATNCKKITKEDGLINWLNESSLQIYNRFRAFQPWPGIYTTYKNQKLSILSCKPHQLIDQKGTPGDITTFENKILVRCKEGSLELLELQLAGKNPTDIRSFINGHPEFIKSTL